MIAKSRTHKKKTKQWTSQRKGTTFLFRVGRRMVRTKTFQKSQITGHKSGSLGCEKVLGVKRC